jgi:putative heme-binding domain-containing protein
MRRLSWARFALTASCVLSLGSPLSAQNKVPNELNDDPEVQRQLMQVPEGFEIQLVASEPTIINPLSMNFDTRGRLWVLCAPRYPQVLPGQEPKDYVVVLDDFDAKGRARKSNVFVEGLTVPTGIMPGDGGVYIGQGESLLHFRDTKGKGKADERKVVFTGFGTADTHHTLNTFRWGPDGSLYFNQGVYIQSTVETPYGPRKLFGGCVWQLRTDRLLLEVYDRSILPNNTWGHAFDSWGQSFLASAWPGALNLCLPDSPLHQTTMQELVPDLKITQVGGERHCGLEVVTGRHFPEDWQGNLLTGDFLAHRIYRYAMADDGHRFVARSLPPLVVSKHRKFRPIDIKMGPDGAVYIADLYQQIIQHNQVDFRDPRRDHTRGRIWRVVRKDRPLLPIPKLTDLPVDRLLDHLKDPEQWTRQQVKRALAEGDRKKAIEGLAVWVRSLKATDADLQRHLLEALWAYQTLDEVQPDLLGRLLRAEDPRVRAAATRVLGYWADRVPDAAKLLKVQAGDSHPRVRLEAVLAASRTPSAAAAEAALAALDRPTNPLLDLALRKTAVLLRPHWYPAFQAGKTAFQGNSKHLSFALQAIRAPDAVPALSVLFQAGKVPAENQASVLQILASLGDSKAQELAWEAALESKPLTAPQRALVLGALEQAARNRSTKPPGEPVRVKALFADPNVGLAAAALRLAGAWKLEGLRAELNQWAAAEATDPRRREAAVEGLVTLGGPATVQQLATIAAGKHAFAVRREAVIGLVTLDPPKAAAAAALLLRQPPPPGDDLGPLFTAFVRKKGGSQALADALKENAPARDPAKIGLRVLAGLGVQAPELSSALQAAAGSIGQRRKLDAAELKRLIAVVQAGDPVRGEAVFRRPELGCFQCHALGGAGGKVGPDLSAIGTSAQVDYLIESIVLPSKVVREGYTTAHVVTLDGKTYSGVVQRESPTELVLRDPLREEIVIPVKQIEEKRVGGSLMPDGLDQLLTDAELADLVRFLSELGRPGPLAITHVRVARAWQFLATPPDRLLVLDDAALGKTLQQDASLSWTPVYSKVSGTLPLREALATSEATTVFIRCAVELTTPGKIALNTKDRRGITLWADGTQTHKAAETVVLELPSGVHTLTFRVDLKERPDAHLRVELADVPGSAAQGRFVTMGTSR